MSYPLNPTLSRLLAHFRLDRTWVKGEGVWLYDEAGRRFLDLYAQYGAVALGHNAPSVTAAVREALDSAEPAMVQPYRARHAEALAAELERLAPGHMAHCVFTTSGAETVEVAVKLARARTGRTVVLSADGSFHGKTLGALAATGQPYYAEYVGPLPGGFERVPFGDADALERRLARSAASPVAALLLEPIQGERGALPAPPGYLARARELCTRHGVALVLDEIQTGLGRTGRLFACEHEGVEPDILLLAKALGGGLFPLGACLASAELWDDRFALRHSSTFANNNVACRVGLAVVDALTRGGLCEAAERQGARLAARLERLAARHPGVVAAVRGRGLMRAVELGPPPPGAGAFLSFLENQGLYAYAVAATIAERAGALVLPVLGGANVLRIAPPLVISDAELDEGLDAIEAVVERLERDPARTIAGAVGALDERPRPAPAARPCPLPRARARGAERPTYAFLVHYTSTDDVAATDPSLAGLALEELERFCAFTADLPPGVLMRAPTVRSAAGGVADGVILALPMLPREMAARGRRYVGPLVAQAVDLAASLGARVVGLGGHTVSYSRRGRAVAGRGPAITTGNALTAGMAFAGARLGAEARGLAVSDASVAVVGARGSVGAAVARLFARERPRRLVLVGNPETGAARLARLGAELEWRAGAVEVATDLAVLAGCDVVVTATGAERPALRGAPLAAGTLVCDVARPPDAPPEMRRRCDVDVIDGGLVALPDPTLRFGVGNLQGLPDGLTLACLSETILLALERETRDRGLGDDIPLHEVDEIMAVAERHGFRPAPVGAGLALTAAIGHEPVP